MAQWPVVKGCWFKSHQGHMMYLYVFEQGSSVSAFSRPSQLNQLKVTLQWAGIPSRGSRSFSSRLDDNRAWAQNLTTHWLGMDFINYPAQF